MVWWRAYLRLAWIPNSTAVHGGLLYCCFHIMLIFWYGLWPFNRFYSGDSVSTGSPLSTSLWSRWRLGRKRKSFSRFSILICKGHVTIHPWRYRMARFPLLICRQFLKVIWPKARKRSPGLIPVWSKTECVTAFWAHRSLFFSLFRAVELNFKPSFQGRWIR